MTGILLGAGAVVAPSCSSAAPSYCDPFCADYIACTDSGKYASGTSNPFCGLEEPKRTAECKRACGAAAGRSDARAELDACATCLSLHEGKDACSDAASLEIAAARCATECGSTRASRALTAFRQTFHLDFDPIDQKTCERRTTVTYLGSDGKLSHRAGEAGPNGSWVGTCPGINNHLVYGPYLVLPSGSYAAGMRVQSSGPVDPQDRVTIDVSSPFGIIGAKRFEPPASLPGEVSFDFELATETPGVEVRLDMQCAPTSTMSIGVQSVYIARK